MAVAPPETRSEVVKWAKEQLDRQPGFSEVFQTILMFMMCLAPALAVMDGLVSAVCLATMVIWLEARISDKVLLDRIAARISICRLAHEAPQ